MTTTNDSNSNVASIPNREQSTKQLNGSGRSIEDVGGYLNDNKKNNDQSSDSNKRPKLQRNDNGSDAMNTETNSTIKEQAQQLHKALQTSSTLGDCKFHGTGNPLSVRSPTTPKTLAVDTLARILQSGYLGQHSPENSNSMPQLKTERGMAGSSIWVDRFRLAGQYGWTGLVLSSTVDTSHPIPLDQVQWFLVETPDDKKRLHDLVVKGSVENSQDEENTSHHDDDLLSEDTWKRTIQNKLVTVGELLEHIQG